MVCTEQPEAEAIDLALAKLHARVEYDEDDDLISALIVAARRLAETHQRRALLTSTWEYSLDFFPIGFSPEIRLPIPANEIVGITYHEAGVQQTLDPARYVVDTASQPARIFPTYGTPWPAVVWRRPASVVIEFSAGYEPEAVPKSTTQAMLMYIAGLYAQREHLSDVSLTEVPMAVKALLDCDSWGGCIV